MRFLTCSILLKWAQVREYYAEADSLAIKAAEDATENAAVILRKRNPELFISVAAIEGSPKSAILKEAETFGADSIILGLTWSWCCRRFFAGFSIAGGGIACKTFGRDCS